MKLQTWITWLCCMAVFVATLVVDLFVWNAEYRNMQKEAQTKALNETYNLINAYAMEFQMKDGSIRSEDQILDSRLQYFFKTHQDEYAICMRYEKSKNGEYRITPEHAYFVYNHTIFTEEYLLSLEFRQFQNSDFSYAEIRYNGARYLIYYYSTSGYINLYHVTSIDYVDQRMQNLAIYMAIITFFVLLVMAGIISAILKHSLRSLKELNETASDIAKGSYDKRVNVRGKNEIATLGTTFNQMAEAVEIRTKSLEESEQQKTLFMGNLTHELKTPLAAISGYTQTLLTVRLDEEDEQEALTYIDEECKRLERLSKKMLRLLELDSEQELELHKIPVKKLFERTKRLCRKLLESKDIRLLCEEHGECFMVEEDLMTEVLINLVDNAVKASGQGDTIRLIAKDHQILVQDTGCGIPEEEQKKILEPFYMIDKSRSRKNGGAGLGLALTALILKRHDVTLAIESEEGKGTTMILNFPVG